ncbi:MAG: PHP domain-containing protein [Candidatus Aminicenantes bacterium]|jgi:PHP family Zn ribbon phosphoesterase|nr:PHP domain-containing protein [Candidatus Aminicenantes bacterium]
MLRCFKADLHIHTCLSPCTELDMSPMRILTAAKKKEIDIIGICDHNSSENSLAVMNAAKKMNINVFPGMEVTSQEEVHVLALFDEIENALKLQEYVYENLPGENDEDAFGMQVIVNEKEEVLGSNNKLLIGATTIPLEKIIQTIHSLNGIAIAAHIDRESFSIIGQLGFIPDNLELDALEISRAITLEEAKKRYSNDYPITCSSDAHYPDDIGKAFTSFLLKDGTLAEVKKALRNEDGRKLIH